MIKFFRNIRKKLLADGKTTNYLKYAIGEIVLVVIGILIALQINNWNEERKERMIEKDYMRNVLEDLQNDLDLYKNFQNHNGEIYILIDSIIYGLKADNRKEKVSELSYWTRMVTLKWMVIHPVDRTFEQMKSSGHLRLVKNKSVSDGISNYYNSLKDFDAYNEAGMIWASDYVEALGKIFDAQILYKILKERKMQEAKPNDMLTEDITVLNQLMNSLQYFNGALNLGEEVSLKRQETAKNLMSLIKITYNLN